MRKVFLMNYPLLTILFVAFLLRAALPTAAYLLNYDANVFMAIDTKTYVCPAISIIENWTFSCNDRPEILRTPGYPLLLIPGLLLGCWEGFTIVLQIILGVITVFLVYKTSLVVFSNQKASLFAAAFYAAEPLSITYCSYLLTETLFTFFVMFFVWALMKYLKTDSSISLFLTSFALVASIYVRPVSYFLPILVATILIIISIGFPVRQRKTMLIKGPIIFLMVSITLIGLWQVRNFVLTGYSGFSSLPGNDLYFHLGANIIAKKDKISYQQGMQVLDQLTTEKYKTPLGKHEWILSEQLEGCKLYAISLIIDNPLIYLQEATKHLMLTLFGPGFNPFWSFFDKSRDMTARAQQNDSLQIQSSLFKDIWQLIALRINNIELSGNFAWEIILIILYGLAILSYPYAVDPKNLPCVLLLLTVVVYFVTISALTLDGNSRFRIPIMPIVCVFAGLGLTWFLETFGNKRKLI